MPYNQPKCQKHAFTFILHQYSWYNFTCSNCFALKTSTPCTPCVYSWENIQTTPTLVDIGVSVNRFVLILWMRMFTLWKITEIPVAMIPIQMKNTMVAVRTTIWSTRLQSHVVRVQNQTFGRNSVCWNSWSVHRPKSTGLRCASKTRRRFTWANKLVGNIGDDCCLCIHRFGNIFWQQMPWNDDGRPSKVLVYTTFAGKLLAVDSWIDQSSLQLQHCH